MVMVTVPPEAKEDISIDEVKVVSPLPEASPVNAILTPSGAVAAMLIAAILIASEGILTFMVPEVKTLLLTTAPPEAVYAHTKEVSVASGKGVVNLAVDTTGESLPLAKATP